MKKVPSLHAFAKTYSRHKPCSICTLPEASQINRAYASGTVDAGVIAKWLITKKKRPVTIVAVQKHFYQGRHHITKQQPAPKPEKKK